ncbi:MAG: fibronectin type III domain-containing protein [Verrucomicrobiales bacterium]|nr:fibronectin type III domain-containing protein [Verrucomicrobiales bacterium]
MRTLIRVFRSAGYQDPGGETYPTRQPQHRWFALAPGFVGRVLGIFAGFASLQAAEVQLAWDPSPSPEVTGYYLYWGTVSQSYDNRKDVGLATTATVTNLVAGTLYYFAVTAYESVGLESDYSNEVSYQPPVAVGNQAPTLAAIANQTINEDTSTGAIALTVGDVDNDVNGLTLTATSSNTGVNRTLRSREARDRGRYGAGVQECESIVRADGVG